MSLKVIMVCTGNTCRSPMAECLLKARLERLGIGGIEVRSAGLYAMDGAPASLGARRAMRRRGLSLEGHAARTFDPEEARGALIVGMTQSHVDSIRQGFGLRAGWPAAWGISPTPLADRTRNTSAPPARLSGPLRP